MMGGRSEIVQWEKIVLWYIECGAPPACAHRCMLRESTISGVET